MTLTHAGYTDYGIDGSATGTSAAISVPAGVQSGDLAVVVGMIFQPADADTVTPPAGWTAVPGAAFHMVAADHWQVVAFYKYISGDTGTWTFSWTNSALATMWFCDVTRGAPAASPIDTAVTRSTGSAGTSETWTGVTLAQAGERVLLAAFNDAGTDFEASGVPSGWTLRSPTGAVFGGDLFDEVFSSAGATGNPTLATFVSGDQTATFIAIKSITSNTTAPSIVDSTNAGAFVQGDTLTANVGVWTGGPTYTYQWKRNGTNIAGATNSSYTLVSADVGATLTVAVTGTNVGGAVTATSAATPTVTAASSVPTNTAVPAITGAAQAGATLTASTGSWTNTPTSFAYQWKRAGTNISGATASTYVVQAADVGSTLTVAVVATNAAGSSSAATSAATNTVVAAGTIITPVVGQTLHLSNGGWDPHSSPTAYAYAWLRCDAQGNSPQAIAAATANTYVVQAADVGNTIRGQVTGSNKAGSGVQTSDPTGIVAGAPTNTALPTISGAAVQGQTLSATTGNWTGSPTMFAYQWKRDGTTNVGTNANTYVPVAGDVGHTLTVTVTAANAAGNASATSAATASVTSSGTSGPVLTLVGTTISWPAIGGATGYKAAISSGPRTDTGRTTTYVELGNVTSWTPPSASGQTLYYGVAAETAGGDLWSSSEVSIAWPVSTQKLMVAVMDTTGWNVDAIFRNIGVTRERLGWSTHGGLPTMQSSVNQGMHPLVVYDALGSGTSPSQAAADVLSMAKSLLAIGVNVIEFGNETYLNYGAGGANGYAAQYHAAHAALAADGTTSGKVTLLAEATSGFYSSRTGGTGNWFTDMKNGLQAVGGSVNDVDGWTLHPYVHNDSMTQVGGDGYGWPLIQTLHDAALAVGFPDVKWWLTELGVQFADGATTQANLLTSMLNDALSTKPYVAFWNWYASRDDSTGSWGLLNSDNSARPAFTSLQSWISSHASQIDG